MAFGKVAEVLGCGAASTDEVLALALGCAGAVGAIDEVDVDEGAGFDEGTGAGAAGCSAGVGGTSAAGAGGMVLAAVECVPPAPDIARVPRHAM